LLLVDANALIHRAYHALPPMTTTKGEMVNAVYGVLLILFRAIKNFEPDYMAAAFDMKGPTFRDKKFADYKAKRQQAPDELYNQIPRVKEVLAALGIPSYEKQGFEADDIIGTISQKASRAHTKTVIISGDMDMLQLVDKHTSVSDMRKNTKDSKVFNEAAVQERFGGLAPNQMQDYKALAGDASDNIPGVEGVGEKTAIQLLLEFGSLENLYHKLENKHDLKPKLAEMLLTQKKQAFLSKELASIEREVPLDFDFTDLEWREHDKVKAVELLQELGFQSLVSQIPGAEEVEEDVLSKIERLRAEGIFSKEIFEIEQQLVPILRKMEKLGIKIDRPYFEKLDKDMQKEIEKLTTKIHNKAGREFNISSTQQLSEVLFETLGLTSKGLKKTPKGVTSTASPELEKLREEHDIISDVLSFRELQKLSTTYAKPIPQQADGKDRVHTHFDQFGAATGRISSLKPNLQNIPHQGVWGKAIRRGFIAEKGFQLVSFDYSQMELRIAAHISKDAKLKEAFEQGSDIHRMTASEVFGIPLQEVSDEMRYRAKALNFGVLYGMGAQGFAKSADISFQEARDFIENYFVRFPGLQDYMERTKEFVRERGYVETLMGRKRYIPEINSHVLPLRAAGERMAVNHPIQGSLADIVKMAMIEVEKGIKERGEKCRMLLQIHDELLFEIADDIISLVFPLIRETMENVYTLDVPIIVEVKGGSSWQDLEPLDN